MDLKNGDGARQKRRARCEEDEKWECSVCTYINSKESYKCEICFMRKGTSTRKPRPNPQVLEQQQLIAQAILKEKDEEHRKKKTERAYERSLTKDSNARLKNFDRSSPLLFEIFANGYSVVITEFPPKVKGKVPHFPDSPAASNCSSLLALSGTSAVPDQLSPTDSNSTSDAAGRAFPFAESDFDGFDAKAKPQFNPPFRSAQSSAFRLRNIPSDRPSFQPEPSPSTHPPIDPTPFVKQEHPTSVISRRANSRKPGKNIKARKRRCLGQRVSRCLGVRHVPSRLVKSTFRPSALSAERFSSNDMKLIISSRRKRIGFTDDRPRLPAKRRKLETSQSIVRKRPTRLSSSRSKDDPPVEQDSTRHSHKEDARSSSKEESTPSSSKKLPTGKRVSSTPVELKCKIRVISPGVSELIPSVSTSAEHSKEDCAQDNAPVERCLSDSMEIPSNIASRLSTESKSTSAMTDSAGAAALEMSD